MLWRHPRPGGVSAAAPAYHRTEDGPPTRETEVLVKCSSTLPSFFCNSGGDRRHDHSAAACAEPRAEVRHSQLAVLLRLVGAQIPDPDCSLHRLQFCDGARHGNAIDCRRGYCRDLGLIGYFKYHNFFALGVQSTAQRGPPCGTSCSRSAISFFTFEHLTSWIAGRRSGPCDLGLHVFRLSEIDCRSDRGLQAS